MANSGIAKLALSLLLLAPAPALLGADGAAPENQSPVTYRGVMPVVKSDVSPPLHSLVAQLPSPKMKKGQYLINDDFWPEHGGPLGPQDFDPIVQDWTSFGAIPAPDASFNGQTNLDGVAPPDPNGDVGPNHVVAMSNSYFAVFSKTGTVLMPATAINTLWAGFGGPCQNENAGDPIVLYDQLADRWLITQFTADGPQFFNCVALSTSGDPTGTYNRWAFGTGTNFPDYPKYGIWPDAYYISTREFSSAGPFAGVGAYALNRAQMIAGDANPQVISFIAAPGGTPFNVGDGLLPTDLDGTILPPSGSPNFFVGSMDNGGPYGAPQDALTIWEFHVDFTTPANSSFTLAATVPITAYDTIFDPCGGTRSCIPQPGTANRIDILSYRQRPLNRLAYRNFGSHESMVTNQSVETTGGIAGIRWWEIRDPAGTPTIFQEGTYSPGVSDGVHRWMASAAMDSAGNIALGYSASSSTLFPSVRYTGRLAGDPLGTMPQGEGSVHEGTGSQTAGGSRWGDYTSTTVDPVDDCTFWMVNEHLPTTSPSGWVLRIGAFRFNECGTPDFYLQSSGAQSVCAGEDAVYSINIGSINSYDEDVTLAASSVPAGATTGFAPNPVTSLPGSSTFTVGTTGVAAGDYEIDVDGTATASPGHVTTVDLSVFDAAPGAPALVAPADAATDVLLSPVLDWSDSTQGQTYTVEISDDAGFTPPLEYEASGIPSSTHVVAANLLPETQYFWRVRPVNECATGGDSTVFSFTTRPIPPTLVVDDDDDAPNVQSIYTAAVTESSAFDVWDVVAEGGEPTLADLAPYQVVIWFSGDRFTNETAPSAGPQAAAEAALGSFLDLGEGRCVWISSQDYLWDMGGAGHNVPTTFMRNYLGVATAGNSSDNGDYTSVTGQNLFAGLGPFSLTYTGLFTDFSDRLAAGPGGKISWVGNNGFTGAVSRQHAASTGFYFAFAWEAMSEANREATMARVFGHCASQLFADGFESNSFAGWSSVTP